MIVISLMIFIGMIIIGITLHYWLKDMDKKDEELIDKEIHCEE